MDSFSTPRLSGEELRRGADLLCQPCRMAPPAFSKAVAFGAYQGHLRSLIHLLKYDGMQPVAHGLGKLLARSLTALAPCLDSVAESGFVAPKEMLVIPVPMHRAKQRQRGFNHAELLAQAAVSRLRRTHSGWELRLATGLLQRAKSTASQAGLTASQRRRNLRGAFLAPQPARLANRHILLVDDVYTTGSTARACSRVLVNAGAASVWIATVARAQREGVALWDSHFLGRAGGHSSPSGRGPLELSEG
ncbi:MAG TPA: ComF family protein [Acidobacteriaceae bacterium]|nr:ComF family protein [Acidobacteriaceae bacterium]